MAEDDRQRYRNEMKDYLEKYINKYKKTDSTSKEFVEKLKSMQQIIPSNEQKDCEGNEEVQIIQPINDGDNIPLS